MRIRFIGSPAAGRVAWPDLFGKSIAVLDEHRDFEFALLERGLFNEPEEATVAFRLDLPDGQVAVVRVPLASFDKALGQYQAAKAERPL